MTNIHSSTRKSDKQFVFEVKLNWLTKKRGLLHANDVDGTLPVATPAQFGGEGRDWSPEHLFLSALSSCYMSTFLFFTKRITFSVTHFECNAIGQIALSEGVYKFTAINLYPKIHIADPADREKASLAIQKTQHACLVSNAVSAPIFYHSEILIDNPVTSTTVTPVAKPAISLTEANEIGSRLGINFTEYNLNEFRRGLEVELEHGKAGGETNITNNDPYLTAKIAWAHLKEIPDYYSRLDKMEEEALPNDND